MPESPGGMAMPAMYSQAVDLGLDGRVALVSAATKGIGLAIAQALAAEGARVAVVARTSEDVQRVGTELKGHGVAADLLTTAGCQAVRLWDVGSATQRACLRQECHGYFRATFGGDGSFAGRPFPLR